MMIELKDTDCIDAPVEASVGFALRASSDSNIGCQPLNYAAILANGRRHHGVLRPGRG